MVIFSNSISLCYASKMGYAKLIRQTEQKYDIPKDLLLSIAHVESRHNPLALNVRGTPYYPKTYDEAIQMIEMVKKHGIRNFDVGIMQINYQYHAENFSDVHHMLSPEANIEYAGKLLSGLFKQYGSWEMAIKRYHSANEYYHRIYAKKVIIAWLQTNSIN